MELPNNEVDSNDLKVWTYKKVNKFQYLGMILNIKSNFSCKIG